MCSTLYTLINKIQRLYTVRDTLLNHPKSSLVRLLNNNCRPMPKMYNICLPHFCATCGASIHKIPSNFSPLKILSLFILKEGLSVLTDCWLLYRFTFPDFSAVTGASREGAESWPNPPNPEDAWEKKYIEYHLMHLIPTYLMQLISSYIVSSRPVPSRLIPSQLISFCVISS